MQNRLPKTGVFLISDDGQSPKTEIVLVNSTCCLSVLLLTDMLIKCDILALIPPKIFISILRDFKNYNNIKFSGAFL